jgi:hypothetical protein
LTNSTRTASTAYTVPAGAQPGEITISGTNNGGLANSEAVLKVTDKDRGVSLRVAGGELISIRMGN